MGASEPKWVNSISNIIGVNSLKVGDLQLWVKKCITIDQRAVDQSPFYQINSITTGISN